jgi:hypothetical protein
VRRELVSDPVKALARLKQAAEPPAEQVSTAGQ